MSSSPKSQVPPVVNAVIASSSSSSAAAVGNNNNTGSGKLGRFSHHHHHHHNYHQNRTSASNHQLLYLKRPTIFNNILSSNSKNDNSCKYLHRYCLEKRLEGYNLCIRHILHDRNAPFKQCSYIHPTTNRRCSNAARRYDRREKDVTYCPWHIKQFNLLRRQNDSLQNFNKKYPCQVETAELLKRKLDELEHYCPNEDHDHRRKNADWDLPEDKHIDPSKYLASKLNESMDSTQLQSNQIDKDFLNTLFGKVLNLDPVDSDNESVETYMDDKLRHAGIYTSEEIARILRNKMLRLQTLYIDLLESYRYVLKNKMRQYYLSKIPKNSDKNLIESSSKFVIDDRLKEEEDYKYLKAMFKYHNTSGVEKLIKKDSSELRRSLMESQPENGKPSPLCIFRANNERCRQRRIPLSPFCRKHILHDAEQKLYRPCANGSPPCLTPVISYVHKNACICHTQMKHQKTDIDKILKSPVKVEPTEPTTEQLNDVNDLENEPELFNSIEEISLGMDPVEPGNLFNLEQFELDTNMLS